MADLRDYKRGALGNADLLEAPRLAYLRAAENEMQEVEAANNRRMMEKAKK